MSSSRERGRPGREEQAIAEEWRMSLQKQQRSTRKNRAVLQHWSQEMSVSGKKGVVNSVNFTEKIEDEKYLLNSASWRTLVTLVRGVSDEGRSQTGTGRVSRVRQ